jgi:hypothetical protein
MKLDRGLNHDFWNWVPQKIFDLKTFGYSPTNTPKSITVRGYLSHALSMRNTKSPMHSRLQMKVCKTWRSFLVRRLDAYPGWLFIPRFFVTGIRVEFQTRATGNLNKLPHSPQHGGLTPPYYPPPPPPSSLFLIIVDFMAFPTTRRNVKTLWFYRFLSIWLIAHLDQNRNRGKR